MTTKRAVLKFVKDHGQGASIDIVDEGEGEVLIYLDAPPRKLWRESMCHVSCAIHGNGFRYKKQINWAETLADVKNIVQLGTEDCEDEDCDVCGEAC